MTSATYKTHPYLSNFSSISISANYTADFYPTFTKAYALLQPQIADKGLAGYSWPTPHATTAAFLHYNSDSSLSQLNETFKPLYDLASQNPTKLNFSTETFSPIPSYFSIFPPLFVEGGGPAILGSRLFPRNAFESEETCQALAELLAQFNYSSTWHLGSWLLILF